MRFVTRKTLFFIWIFFICTPTSSGTLFHSQLRSKKNHHNNRKNVDNALIVPTNLQKKVDTSCKNIRPPYIENGVFVKIKHGKLSEAKKYMVARYECHSGFKFANNNLKGVVYCSKRKWIGKRPHCEKNGEEKLIQGDDPSRILNDLHYLEKEKCQEFGLNCQHSCDVKGGQATCTCFPGFELVDGHKCVDIDECEQNNAGCDHLCKNILGSFKCSCKPGFRLNKDSRTCEDINECHLRNGHGPCQDTCHNTYGSYKCSCQSNGTKLASDGHTCADINECTEGIAGCSHSCINVHGKSFCTCPEGMVLGEDWKTCNDVNECENPAIKSSCIHGCVNIIGSYHCSSVIDDHYQSDQPTERADYENEDYEDEDYEGGEEYEDENYDEQDKKEKPSESPPSKTAIESTTDTINVAAPVLKPKPDEKHNIETDKENNEVVVKENKEEDYEEYEEYEDENDSKFPSTTTDSPTTEISVSTTTQDPVIKKEYKEDVETSKENKEDVIVKEHHETDDTTKDESRKEKEMEPRTTDKEEEYDEDYDDYEEEYDENEPNEKSEGNANESTAISRSGSDSTEQVGIPPSDRRILNETVEDLRTTEGTISSTTEAAVQVPSSVETTTKFGNNEDDDKYNEKNEEGRHADVSTLPTILIDHKANIIDQQGVTIEPTNTTPESTTIDSRDLEEYEDENEVEKARDDINVIKECASGYRLLSGNCTDINECDTGENTCSHSCENTIGGYQCSCPKGFQISPDNVTQCVDIDECLTSPCSDICSNTPGGFECRCPDGLVLRNSTHCANLSCSHTTTKVNGVVQCTCPLGFVLRSDERTCEDIDECLIENSCSHMCKNTLGSFRCSCPHGFKLERDERHCVDVDECQETAICPQTCENVPGSFKCLCEDGFQYDIDSNKCVDINECDSRLSLSECEQICINYEGGYECGCKPGYVLSDDDFSCRDIDECAKENGHCSQICENLLGTFICRCKENYNLQADNVTCIINNPCHEHNGGCSHECVNEEGNPVCKCPENQVLEGKNCFKVDPCVENNNGGCSHICVNANGIALCKCPEGFILENSTHCSEINRCLLNNGNCSHFCEFLDREVRCGCPERHILVNGTQCVEEDLCRRDNGGCSHLCRFEDHKVICLCPETHDLHNDTHCAEKSSYLVNRDGCSHGNCTKEGEYDKLEEEISNKIDPCLVDNGGCSHDCFSDNEGNVKCSCPENHSLTDTKNCILEDLCAKNNGGCSHICNFSSQKVVCSCPPGHELIELTYCKKINSCNLENGGCSDYCEDIQGNPKCSCPEKYALGPDNKTCIIADPCSPGNGGCSHYCRDEGGIAQCYCPEHFDLINEKECVRINPCLINNGGCSRDCEFDTDGVKCLCPDGYQLETKTCVLINPCSEKNGGCSHACTAINGQAVCRCPPDHELVDKTCFKINPCAIDNGGCSHGCSNDHGDAICLCPPGYKLFGKRCLDEDPCQKHNGGCSHFCSNIDGRRECSCPPGYVLRPNRRVCKEINECRLNRGGCSHGCKNTPGSYECTCPHGFQLESNNRTCVDVDECQTDNGGCEMFCKNYKGSFRCDCAEGYILQRDRRTCRRGEVYQCRIPQPPNEGVMRCLGHRTDYGLTVPSGTKCNVWCNEGFQLRGRSQRNCNEAGEWDNLDAECIVSTCPKLPSFKNGWFLPGICNTGKTYPGESCLIHCRSGYRISDQFQSATCGDDLKWSIDMSPDILDRFCVKDYAQEIRDIYIRCPSEGRLNFVLPPGQRSMTVRFPQPQTNVDFQKFVISQPSWGKRLETTLSVGTIDVKFTAVYINRTASCKLTIAIEDKESPKVFGCPQDIEKTLERSQSSQIVFWTEPQFEDNVEISSVYKSRVPGTEFVAGLHHINYIATDGAGNRASCNFIVDVKGANELELINSLQTHDYTVNNNRRNGNGGDYYKAVLICPSGAQYEDLAIREPEPGCKWKHIKVSKPQVYDPAKALAGNVNYYTPNLKNSVYSHYFQRRQPFGYHSNDVTIMTPPRIFAQSRLPGYLRNHRRKEYFRWNRR